MLNVIPQIKTAVLLLVAGVLLATVTAVLIMILMTGSDEITTAQTGLLIGEILLPIPIFFWAKRRRINMRSLFRLNPVSLNTILAAVPIAIGLTIIADEIDRITQTLIKTPAGFSKIQEIMMITDPLSAFFVVGVVIIIAPFIEEIIFRGFLQRILERRLRDITKAILLSALIFALIHFNPWWAIQIYIIGIFMGFVAWKTNSVWVSFFLHAFNNGVAVLFTHFSEERLNWYEWHGHVSPLILSAGLIILVGGLILFGRIIPVINVSDDAILIENFKKNGLKINL